MVTRARRGKKKPTDDADETPTEIRASMNWAQRLKVWAAPALQHRSERGPIEICSECGGAMRVIVGMPHHSIEDPTVIRKVLAHLSQKAGKDQPDSLPPCRGPRGGHPPGDLFA